MENYSLLEKEWINTLKGSDRGRITTTLHEIRNTGSVKILPFLYQLINKNTDPLIRNEILVLLSEIKSQEAVPLIAESLAKNDFGDYLPAVIATCWQSGLNFSKYLRVFAGIFIHADYQSSLEAFTVIEESFAGASDMDIADCHRFLRDSECIVADEKLPLLKELMKVLGEN